MPILDYNPDYTVSPAELLAGMLSSLKPAPNISEEAALVIDDVKALRPITGSMAEQLQVVTGVDKSFWLNAEAIFRQRLDAIYTAAVNSITRHDTRALAACLELNPSLVTVHHGVSNLALIHIAAMRGDLTCVNIIHQAGGDVNLRDGDGNTALHYAIPMLDIELVQSLISYGIDVNAANNAGVTAMHFLAAVGGSGLELVKIMLRCQLVKNARSNSGHTVVYNSVNSRSDPVLIKTLIDAGFDWESPDNDGISPKNLAKKLKRDDLYKSFP